MVTMLGRRKFSRPLLFETGALSSLPIVEMTDFLFTLYVKLVKYCTKNRREILYIGKAMKRIV